MGPDPPGPQGHLLQVKAVRPSRVVSFPDLHCQRITLVSLLGPAGVGTQKPHSSVGEG